MNKYKMHHAVSLMSPDVKYVLNKQAFNELQDQILRRGNIWDSVFFTKNSLPIYRRKEEIYFGSKVLFRVRDINSILSKWDWSTLARDRKISLLDFTSIMKALNNGMLVQAKTNKPLYRLKDKLKLWWLLASQD